VRIGPWWMLRPQRLRHETLVGTRLLPLAALHATTHEINYTCGGGPATAIQPGPALRPADRAG